MSLVSFDSKLVGLSFNLGKISNHIVLNDKIMQVLLICSELNEINELIFNEMVVFRQHKHLEIPFFPL